MRGMTILGVLGALLLGAEWVSAEEKNNVPPPGFTAVFNGKDLAGWQIAVPLPTREKLKKDEAAYAADVKSRNDKHLKHWMVEGGVLINDGRGASLQTVKDYGNFELLIDWKIEEKGDSGLYLRGTPQVQIWDSDSLDPKRYVLEYKKGSGALWNNKAKEDKVPLKRADKAPGEWNTFHIVMKGDKVTVKLNGELVVNQVALNAYGPFGKTLPAKGPLELQQHSKQDGTPGKLWFRNIYIKDLPEE